MNGCSGHGRCTAFDMCVCYRNWQANDCSERVCQFGKSFVDSPKGDLDGSGTIDGPDDLVAVNSFVYPYGTSETYPNFYDSRGRVVTQSGHAYAECSNAGACNRKTGVCECHEGFEGVACQRLTCPTYPGYYGSRVCSGHGQCRTVQSITADSIDNRRDAYNLWDKQISTACVCDTGFFGGDCHMRACKKDIDPLYQDDFTLVSYGRYYLAFLATKAASNYSDGAFGQAYFRVRIFDNSGKGWLTEPISYPATCDSILASLSSLPHRLIDVSTMRCAHTSVFKLDPLADRPAWDVSLTSRWKMFFNSVPGNHLQGPRLFSTRISPVFWAQFPRGYSYKANDSSADGTLTGNVYLLEFNGNAGDIREPQIVLHSDGSRPTIAPAIGEFFTKVWTDGQKAESTDHFSNLCPQLTVRIDTSNPNYHFITGYYGEEKIQLMRCLGDSDYDPNNNHVIPGSMGKSWDYGSVFFPHVVRMVRVVTDDADSGFYVALYYDTSITGLDSGGYGDTLSRGLSEGMFKLLHPFESLDHYDEVQYYVYTTKGTLQVAGNRTEAAFDFASHEFYTTNQSHIIDYGVYWRINETQTVELTGTDVDEIQVIRTAVTAPLPEIQSVSVKALRVLPVQYVGVILSGSDIAARLALHGCTIGAKCALFEDSLTGSVTFRFDPSLCGNSGATVNSDSNFCLKAMSTLATPQTAYYCPTASDCVSAPVPFGSTTMTAATIKTTLCSIKGLTASVSGTIGSTSFMLDNNNDCVAVEDESQVLGSSEYRLRYRITFDGDVLQGDIPAIEIYSSSGAYTKTSPSLLAAYAGMDGLVSNSYSILSTGSTAYRTTRGNQVDGFYKLTYTCEGKWVEVVVTASVGSARGDHRANMITMDASYGPLRLNHVLRLRGSHSYHRVIALHSSCSYTSCTMATVEPYIDTKLTNFVWTAELGVFYSDPGHVDSTQKYWKYGEWQENNFGVSSACIKKNTQTSDLFSPYDSDSTFQSTLVSALAAMSPTGMSGLTVTRALIDPHAACTIGTTCFIGYTYSLTFTHSHGDVIPLIAVTSNTKSSLYPNLWPTTPLSTVTVVVATERNGAMIYDGYFDLTQTYPHVYVGTPAASSAEKLRWNVQASELQSKLSAITAFGTVSVSRSAYTPSTDTRWSGGYTWTVAFTSRNGKLPQMGATQVFTLLTAAASTVTVGTEDTPLATDDPGVSRQGNQVAGTFGFSFTDNYGTTYTASSTMFNVLSGGQPITAAAFQTTLRTMLGNKRITAVKVTRSSTTNAAMGYTYTIEYQGKHLAGNLMNLLPITSALTMTASTATVDIIVSEVIVGRNDTVYNTQYDGEIACESRDVSASPFARTDPFGSACLSKGDYFMVFDPYNPAFNPPYLNMYKAVSVYSKTITPYTPGLGKLYPGMSRAESDRMMTYKRYVIQSDIASNWAQDTSGQGTFRFYKFTPHEGSTYQVVTECSNRGTCNHFEGICDCFHGYSGDACSIIESMAV